MSAISLEGGALLFVLALAGISVLAPPILNAFGIGTPTDAGDNADNDESLGLINPASGLPMRDSMFDVAGNAFGSSSVSSDND